jgi:hypothetical protein
MGVVKDDLQAALAALDIHTTLTEPHWTRPSRSR